MKEIIQKWCETDSINGEEVAKLIKEYLSYDGRTISEEELQKVFFAHQIPILPSIDLDYIIRVICHHNGWYIETLIDPRQSIYENNRPPKVLWKKLFTE